MTHELIREELSCSEHKDCTVLRYSNDLGHIGDRHLHQWFDEQGLWGRPADLLVMAQIQVGILFGYDEETGVAEFEPDAQVLTAMGDHESVPLEERVPDTWPWVNDHRTGKKVVIVEKNLPRAPAVTGPKAPIRSRPESERQAP